MVKIYTRKGDDGTTSLWYGGRVAKSDARTEAYWSLDEAASALHQAHRRPQRRDHGSAIARGDFQLGAGSEAQLVADGLGEDHAAATVDGGAHP